MYIYAHIYITAENHTRVFCIYTHTYKTFNTVVLCQEGNETF